MRTSYHSRSRLVERNEDIRCHPEAKKLAKLAFKCGDTINNYQRYPQFFSYLSSRRNESITCRIRIYRGNIYIWKGNNKTLVTAHPIPDRFIKEMEEKDNV